MMIEYRNNQFTAELRMAQDNGESRTVVGYALKFNSLSNDLGGFYETIEPGSLDGVIERSDVFALLDHNRDRGVLARSLNGSGSLKLIVDNIGLKYEFEAPNTALGTEVLENIRRGEIFGSSFGFTVDSDGQSWEKRADGSILRTIRKFDRLYDVSPVYNPAYSQTVCDTRCLEELQKLSDENIMTEDAERFAELRAKIEELELKLKEKEERSSEKSDEEEVQEENNRSGEETEKKEECTERSEEDSEEKKDEEERADETEKSDEEDKEDEAENKEDEEGSQEETEKRNFETININPTTMKKEKFSLLKSINDMVEGRSMSDITAKVHEAGMAEFRKSGLATSGGLMIPLSLQEEKRADLFATQPGQGQEAVASDWLGIYNGLREALVFDRLGCTTMTGLTGNIVLPAYTNTVAYWKSEGAKADDGAGNFSTREMKPHRLTALVSVSKQLLLQDSVGAEEMLRRDIVEALAYAWQKQVFSSDAGTVNVKPAGIFNGVVADSNPLTFEDVVLMEQTLKHDNIPANYKYLLSTSAEAITRTTRVDAGSGIMIQNNDTINGIPVVSSGIVEDKAIALGNWSELINGIWSGISLEIDKYTRLDEDVIRLVAVTYVDSIVRRDNAIVKKILA